MLNRAFAAIRIGLRWRSSWRNWRSVCRTLTSKSPRYDQTQSQYSVRFCLFVHPPLVWLSFMLYPIPVPVCRYHLPPDQPPRSHCTMHLLLYRTFVFVLGRKENAMIADIAIPRCHVAIYSFTHMTRSSRHCGSFVCTHPSSLLRSKGSGEFAKRHRAVWPSAGPPAACQPRCCGTTTTTTKTKTTTTKSNSRGIFFFKFYGRIKRARRGPHTSPRGQPWR